MKSIYTLLCVLCIPLLMTQEVSAQVAWPQTMTAQGNKVIKMYQWQPESYGENILKARAAISVLEPGKTDPVFGMAWLRATTRSSGSQVQVQSARITAIKLPGESNEDQLDDLKLQLEEQIARWNIQFPAKDLENSLSLNSKEEELSRQISNKAPKVIYANTASILVLIDGAPKLQKNTDWDAEVVINTPFTIIKNADGQFYLYGGKHWYSAPAATGPYALHNNVSQKLAGIAEAIKAADKDQEEGMETSESTIYKIVVSTEPAELIQSAGEANFSPVEGTSLLYVANSDDDIFMDLTTQQYFVLLSGRWFAAKTLNSNWQYVSPENLPAEFANIKEGSPKDNVLASVAGTDAATDALQEAEVPQTAKVDRKNATANVTYDGDPQFEDIDGLDMAYATNTSASVLRWRGRYYAVDNGVWFEASRAAGPWVVAVERPTVVSLIPPRYPVYHVKYVYIYDVMPDYVYMGYTPGYLNTFIYGPTVVYGTGFYYRPWYGHYYYPRPCTWGYGVRYNPWFGWGFGFNFNAGWFHAGINVGRPWGGYYSGGWWGPRYYSMPYCYRPNYGGRSYGYYNPRYYDNRSRSIHYANRTNNIYVNRNNVVTRTTQRSIAPNRSNYYGRRDAVGYNNGQRPNRTYNNDNRGGQYNNRNEQSRINNQGNRSYDRNSRADNPRQRDITPNNGSRPNREYTPGNGSRPNSNTGSRPNNNNGSRPANSNPGNREGERPVRTNPGTGGGNERRDTERPRSYNNDNRNNSSGNGGREMEAPRNREYRAGNENRQSPPNRSVTPPQRQQQPSARPQSSPSQPSRSVERRDNGGNRGGGNQGGGSQGGNRGSSSGNKETSRPGRG
ncbi:MAG: hypothetical protein P0Y53_04975 [Candidatus Pseudobacter hemicellulosilyticus]|uniref:Carbohydrate-binding family V/XII n=1 Tax=Candidatus Pseudobacter hemicellulosilyticus TaxID=3121375 RepID=A0AAJ5WUK5_9BACT|nr:MAG: hypothetical protein P0Y53_04975 [Pseudobacter sp.]